MALTRILEAQLAALEQLQSALLQEQQLLGEARADGDALQHAATEKQALFQQLEQLDQQRRAQQHQAQLPDTAEGARQLAEGHELGVLWRQILQAGHRAAHLNQLNGELIQHRLEHNQNMLNIIRDTAGAALYGPDGQSSPIARRLNSRA